MLVLSRKKGEALYIGRDVQLRVLQVVGPRVRLGIEAPEDIDIYREEASREGRSGASTSKSSQRRQPVRRQANVLIVDDNPLDRALYRELLGTGQSDEFAFREAELAEEGLDMCRAHTPDCVLLDFRMPDFTGVEFLEALVSQTGRRAFPIVMLTRFGNEELAVKAMKMGAADYLVKSTLTAGTLQSTVHDVIRTAPSFRWN